MKKLFIPVSFLALNSLLLFSGCRKDQDAEPEMTFESAEDNARLESESESTQNFIDAEALDPGLKTGQPSQTGNLPACATRSWNNATNTLTIDFGPVNCLCKDGRYRRGKITAVFEGPWRVQNSKVTIKPLDYYVNDNLHTGTRVVTSLGNENAAVNYKYQVEVIDAAITFTDGSARSWNALRELERIAGQGTLTIADDEYLVTGTSTGTNRRNVGFTTVINQPLKKVFRQGCFRNFISGTVTITNANNRTLLLDYDPGKTEACDKTAAVTSNGKTRTITLR